MAFPHSTLAQGGALPPPIPLVVTLPPPAGVPPPYTLTIFEDPAGCGPGGALWDASVVLAQYVNTLGDSLRGTAVIELGAGTGLPGLAAARLGADVTLTDRPRTLGLLQRNAEANDLTVHVEELEWGQSMRRFSKRFDLVLAADVVCHEDSFEPLLVTLRALAGGGGEVLLCNKCRDVAEHAFWEAAAETFHIEIVAEGMPETSRDGDDLPVLLYRLRAKAAEPQRADGGGS